MSASNDPAMDLVSITPSDTVNIPLDTADSAGVRGFSVNVDGDVSVVTLGGKTCVLSVLKGYVYPVRLIRINSTGTTATGIVGWV